MVLGSADMDINIKLIAYIMKNIAWQRLIDLFNLSNGMLRRQMEIKKHFPK
jgi:hypothetical protein